MSTTEATTPASRARQVSNRLLEIAPYHLGLGSLCALVHDPQTLLFDEPSNALDIAAQMQLRDTMRQLAQSGLGILLVTHHVAEIIPEIERVVLLRDGKIVADGPKEKLLTAPTLTDLFDTKVQIGQHDGYYHLY